MNIANAIAQQRKLMGMNQNELAQKAGITVSIVHDVEEGKINPTYDELEKIVTAGFHISLTKFFQVADKEMLNYAQGLMMQSIQDLPAYKVILLAEVAKNFQSLG